MKLFRLATLILILALFAIPALADEHGESTVSEAPIEAPAESWLAEIAFASVLVTSLVAAVKLVPVKALQDIPAPRIALFFNIAIWMGYRYLVEMGADTELFINYISNLGNLGQSVLSIVATYFGATGVYLGAKKTDMPLLSVSKPSEPKG